MALHAGAPVRPVFAPREPACRNFVRRRERRTESPVRRSPPNTSSMPLVRDPQKLKLYTSDQVFWATRDAYWSDLISFEDVTSFTETVFADGLLNPYPSQLRKTCRGPVTVGRTDTLHACAYLKQDRIVYHATFQRRWVVLHEVAHLLTRESRVNPHGWRFVAVYANMIHRHVDRQAASSFLGLCQAFGVSFAPQRRAA